MSRRRRFNRKIKNQERASQLRARIIKLNRQLKRENKDNQSLQIINKKLTSSLEEANAKLAKYKDSDDVVDAQLSSKLSQCEAELDVCERNFKESLTLIDQLIKNIENTIKIAEPILKPIKDIAKFKSKHHNKILRSGKTVALLNQPSRIPLAPTLRQPRPQPKMVYPVKPGKSLMPQPKMAYPIKTDKPIARIDQQFNAMPQLLCDNTQVKNRTVHFYNTKSHNYDKWKAGDYVMSGYRNATPIGSDKCRVTYNYRGHRPGKSNGFDERIFTYKPKNMGLGYTWVPEKMGPSIKNKHEEFVGLRDLEVDYPNSRYITDIGNDSPTINYL